MEIFNSLNELAGADLFTNPDVMRDQPFTVDGLRCIITHEGYVDVKEVRDT